MSDSSFDVVVVRKSGPVHTMKFRGWWIYLMLMIMLIMVVGLGFAAYILLQQQRNLVNLGNDTRLLMLRAERLEALVQEQETRELLAMQAAQEQAEQAKEKADKGKGKPTQEDSKKAETSGSEQAVAKSGQESAKPGGESAAATTAPETPPEPVSADWVEVNELALERKGAELVVNFKVLNKKPTDLAAGYVTVLLQGTRNGKPWHETWPAMRLTPQLRPKNFRRGSPFSVQNYRTVQARFVVGSKKFEALEILIYSREGKLSLVLKKQMEMPETDYPTPAPDNQSPSGQTGAGKEG